MNLELNRNQAKNLIIALGIANSVVEATGNDFGKNLLSLKDYIFKEIGNNFDDLVVYDEDNDVYKENEEFANFIDEIIMEYENFIINDYEDNYEIDYDEDVEDFYDDYDDEDEGFDEVEEYDEDEEEYDEEDEDYENDEDEDFDEDEDYDED